jgi:signal transduction histidine kinase
MKILGFPWTIRTRLSLLYAGAFFLAGVALIVVIYLYLGQVLDRQFIVRLESGAPVTALGLGPPGDLPPIADGALAPGAPGVPPTVMEEVRRVNLLVRQARLNTLDTMLVASLAMVGILTVAAGIIGWLVAGQALQPLREITATARRVADRSLHERIALTGPNDEIKDLADTLDAMLERLDRSFDSQRRFVANASHELRTPLTITRTLIEVALLDAAPDSPVRQLATTLLAVNQRHERLTDGLLTLAASEQRVADFRPVEMAEVAGYVATELQGLAAKDGIDVRMDLRPARVLGDPFLLERVVQNLVENAIRYNLPSQGWVRAATETVGDNAVISVENSGPHIPSYEVPSLFEPFRRLASSERIADSGKARIGRGSGLGLSIVRSISHAHHGEVQASARDDGGLLVRISLPAVADADEPDRSDTGDARPGEPPGQRKVSAKPGLTPA